MEFHSPGVENKRQKLRLHALKEMTGVLPITYIPFVCATTPTIEIENVIQRERARETDIDKERARERDRQRKRWGGGGEIGEVDTFLRGNTEEEGRGERRNVRNPTERGQAPKSSFLHLWRKTGTL